MNKKILHVDDSLDMLRVVSAKLTSSGYEVVSLDDPTKAIRFLVDNHIRVCLLDINMSQMNGLELLEKIKEYDGGIQVVMLSGEVSQSNILDSNRLGAEAFFFKPVESFDPILESLDAIFERELHWWNVMRNLQIRKKEQRLEEQIQ
ncbi:MAG: hypothetical protein COA78_30330 [Blastopirellula sp.]|nr:MAG: hypothetical protein COA78_30330 [Blastopirellula sp.]